MGCGIIVSRRGRWRSGSGPAAPEAPCLVGSPRCWTLLASLLGDLDRSVLSGKRWATRKENTFAVCSVPQATWSSTGAGPEWPVSTNTGVRETRLHPLPQQHSPVDIVGECALCNNLCAGRVRHLRRRPLPEVVDSVVRCMAWKGKGSAVLMQSPGQTCIITEPPQEARS